MSNKVKVGVIVIGLLIIALYGGFKMYASSIAKDKIDEAIAEHVPDHLSIDYKNISVDLLGLGVHINDIVVSSQYGEDGFKINEVFLADFDDKSEIPTYFDISVNGVHIEELVKTASKKEQKIINLAFGIKKTTDPVLLNSSIKYNYNDNKEIKYEMAFGADNVGNMRAKIHIGGINKPTKANIDNPMAGTDNVSIIAISLGYEDDSLIERLSEDLLRQNKARGRSPTDLGALKEKIKRNSAKVLESKENWHGSMLKNSKNLSTIRTVYPSQ